jgi:PhzF family phenazine biosynthesis protein
VQLHIVDVFTDIPFKGNPAAVCLIEGSADDGWMQSVAAEMNLAATAFLRETDSGWELRWFSPIIELDLCGHGTLASAHILWETGRNPENIRFDTRGGMLTATRNNGWIVVDFPATPPKTTDVPDALIEALGVVPLTVARSNFDYLVEVETPAEVVDASPQLSLLSEVETRGVMLTAAGGEDGADFTSRFFAPAAGIPEDPVTGSAHCCLGPFWADRLGKNKLIAHQASSRGGVLRVKVLGDRVLIGGQAVTVLSGELR